MDSNNSLGYFKKQSKRRDRRSVCTKLESMLESKKRRTLFKKTWTSEIGIGRVRRSISHWWMQSNISASLKIVDDWKRRWWFMIEFFGEIVRKRLWIYIQFWALIKLFQMDVFYSKRHSNITKPCTKTINASFRRNYSILLLF